MLEMGFEPMPQCSVGPSVVRHLMLKLWIEEILFLSDLEF
jgi:hypothetical protein